jgi:exocyst complex component 4
MYQYTSAVEFANIQSSFVTSSLSHLLDTLLLRLSTSITHMNTHGLSHLQLNILVLQQNLKNVEPAALLTRSATYYDFFTDGPDALIARAKQAKEQEREFGYTYAECQKIIELFYSEGLESERRDVAVQAKRSCEASLLALSEWLY